MTRGKEKKNGKISSDRQVAVSGEVYESAGDVVQTGGAETDKTAGGTKAVRFQSFSERVALTVAMLVLAVYVVVMGGWLTSLWDCLTARNR